MSALPCPVADPFAAADQTYATITEFLHSKEACQVKHSELERQLEGMGRELMRKLLQAHLDMRQPGQSVEPVRDAAGTPLTPTPVHVRGRRGWSGASPSPTVVCGCVINSLRCGTAVCAFMNFRNNARSTPFICRS